MYKFITSVLLLLMGTIAGANNVTLTNVSVGNNAAGNGKVIQFDVGWENSWRTASTGNFDGVWVFFKFKDNDGNWWPLRFNGNNIAMPGGVSYTIGNSGTAAQGVGMFLFRSSAGSGNFTITAVKAGIENFPGTHDVKGFALEMVYIPQGSFYVGDTLTAGGFEDGQNSNLPYQVTGNGATVQMGTAAGRLYDPFSSYTGFLTGYPTGYTAFWMMKYELSVGGYRDFLNCLNFSQQEKRFADYSQPTAVVGTNLLNPLIGNSLEIAVTGKNGFGVGVSDTAAVVGCDADNDNIFNEATDGEWKAVSTLNWSDICAYLDWTGLRPMTELEFEKACRGPLASVPGEYAWGSADITNGAIMGAYYNIINTFLNSESISNASSFLGNCVYSSTINDKLIRGGIFANAGSTRVSAGAGYYGNMELSGNLFELCVTTANAAGRSYNGKHGDGVLTADGNANENGWPGVNGSTSQTTPTGNYNGGDGVVSNPGILQKGGMYGAGELYQRVSNRHTSYFPNAVILTNAFQLDSYGIRGVRDAN
ncbi:MAG: SUMF1/EgtB/PvdO family nonheme iron enzyme [Bacteroidota bacterium]